MLRADLTPKPVYQSLKRLIHQQWRTVADGKTDAQGHFQFRGFHGQYRLVVQGPKGPIEHRCHLSKAGPNRWTVER